jgi:hypothetical protein
VSLGCPKALVDSERIITRPGAQLRYLPPYSPNAQLKAHLRKAKQRTILALYEQIGEAIDCFDPTECRTALEIWSDLMGFCSSTRRQTQKPSGPHSEGQGAR